MYEAAACFAGGGFFAERKPPATAVMIMAGKKKYPEGTLEVVAAGLRKGECQNRTDKTYGYRRAWKWLKDRNINKNPKTVLKIMKKYGLLSEIHRRRK